jgi:hypothetical protein
MDPRMKGLCRTKGSAARFDRYGRGMTISIARQQFLPAIIRHAVWLHVRFTLSYRDGEGPFADRGLGSPTRPCDNGY